MVGILNLPNLLTIARVVAVPVICLLIAAGSTELRWAALILYPLAALTDWLDGYLARRLNLMTPFGRMLDHIADKLLVLALLIVLAWDHSFSGLDLIPAVAIMMRETLVAGVREFLGPKGVVLHATMAAKWSRTVQFVAVAIVIAERLLPGLGLVSDVVLWISGLLTVWTGTQYFAQALPHLGKEASP
jgi:CDP-diacylglycerol--glycerol-3-phosphate 3-phosphatidyltransferase